MKMEDEFISELLSEAKRDEVGLWFIIARLKEEKGISDPILLKAAVLKCCERLLSSGQVVVRFPNDDHPFANLSAVERNQILNRIQSDWVKLGREPNIGEIVTFE
jgi:hypothetical protein